MLNLPDYINRSDFETYWQHIHDYAKNMKLHITGGHTNFDAFNHSSIAGGLTLFSIGNSRDILSSSHADEGDLLFMSKTAGLTACSMLAEVFSKHVESKLGKTTTQKARSNFWNISVLTEAAIVFQLNRNQKVVSAMHDVTEGGVLGAVYEFVTASGLGVQLYKDNIPVLKECEGVARTFNLDATGIIGAGAMLIACKAQYKGMLITQMKNIGILCTEIDVFTKEQEGKYYWTHGEKSILCAPNEDAYWAVFSKSLKDGLS